MLFLGVVDYLWQPLGLAFYRIIPVLMTSPWQQVLAVLGYVGVGAFFVVIHLLHRPLLRHSLWVLPLMIQMNLVGQTPPPLPLTWSSLPSSSQSLLIFPEGQGRDWTQGSAIVSHRWHDQGHIYHTMRGIGDALGMAQKKHLIPLIESGYTQGSGHPLIEYHGLKLWVLICYDAFFSDVLIHAQDADLIVVVSQLSDLKNTPMPTYFLHTLRFIAMSQHKDLIYIDGLGISERIDPSGNIHKHKDMA